MFAPVILALLIAPTVVALPNAWPQDRPLDRASTAPDPLKPDPPWPPPGVFRPGIDVTVPKQVKNVYPRFTPDALRAKVQGVVGMEAIVLPDGTVGEVRVVRSLDKRYGLDDEAVKALKQWEFTPGKNKDGISVPVVIDVEMSFSVGKLPKKKR